MALAAAFLGPRAVGVTLAVAVAMRIGLGGAGLASALAGMGLAAGAGLLWRRPAGSGAGPLQLAALGVIGGRARRRAASSRMPRTGLDRAMRKGPGAVEVHSPRVVFPRPIEETLLLRTG